MTEFRIVTNYFKRTSFLTLLKYTHNINKKSLETQPQPIQQELNLTSLQSINSQHLIYQHRILIKVLIDFIKKLFIQSLLLIKGLIE